MPNSQSALHGFSPPQFTVCAPVLPLIHVLCVFFRLLLTPLSTAPSPPPSQFTVCTSRFARLRIIFSQRRSHTVIQERSGDPNPQYFSKSTAVPMVGVLPYKWEAYCSTNGRRISAFPFLRSLDARKVRRYKWGGYCHTHWRCTAQNFLDNL